MPVRQEKDPNSKFFSEFLDSYIILLSRGNFFKKWEYNELLKSRRWLGVKNQKTPVWATKSAGYVEFLSLVYVEKPI
jgi:hypothetical protein